MDKTFKVWHHVIAARIIPVNHLTEVTKDCVILLFSIHSGQAIDVIRLIYQTILYETRHQNIRLLFPSLITDLCAKASVKLSTGEELIHLSWPLNKNTIFQIRDTEEVTPRSSSSRPQPQVPPC